MFKIAVVTTIANIAVVQGINNVNFIEQLGPNCKRGTDEEAIKLYWDRALNNPW